MAGFVEICCLHCKQQAFAPLKEVKRGNGKFCSLSCSAKYHGAHRPKPKPNIKCAYCKKEFYKSPFKQTLSKSGLFFCCREHKDAAQCIGGIKEIMPPHYGTADPAKYYRKTALAHYGVLCTRCGYNEHKAAIVVHHKDRDRTNDSLLNLEVLCANCHAIEHWGKD